MDIKMKALTDDSPYPQDITLGTAIARSAINDESGEMMERLLTVLYEKGIVDIRDLDRIVAAPGLTLVPEDYTPGGGYNPYG